MAGADPRAGVGAGGALGAIKRAQVVVMLSVPFPKISEHLPPVRALVFANAGAVDSRLSSYSNRPMR